MASQLHRIRALGIIGVGCWAALGANLAQGQIIPDQSLGAETSTVRLDTLDPGHRVIEGGAARGTGLFHSFLDFNVNAGERVYFASPPPIQTIFSRVTGSDPSLILGTLGVAGTANLFFLNPQGILFGPEARLDITGSFTASTANTLKFGEGFEFSTIAPSAPPLLQVNQPLGLGTGVAEIQSLGDLRAGQNLTLQGKHLQIQGKVAGAGDITLVGETIDFRDSLDRPLQLSAGGNLLVEGSESVNVSALQNPESWLYGDRLTLRSSQAVGGDAHFYSGRGGFRVETLTGDLNTLTSPKDPIIRSLGDISLNVYAGSSLHIIAGGAVTIGPPTASSDQLILLTGLSDSPEDRDPAHFLKEAVTLSNGTIVQIDGAARPTLDIRAGVDPAWVGIPTIALPSGCLDCTLPSGDPPTTGDIQISSILIGDPEFLNPDGNPAYGAQILLTNQYHPALPGSIRISEISPQISFVDFTTPVGNVAQVWIDSAQDVYLGSAVTGDLPGNIDLSSSLLQPGDSTVQGGHLTVLAGRDVNVLGNAITNACGGSVCSGIAGNIDIQAAGNLTLTAGNALRSEGLQGGHIQLTAGGDLNIVGSGAQTASISSISNLITPDPAIPGQGGNIELRSSGGSIYLTQGAQVFTGNVEQGIASVGSIVLDADQSIVISGTDSAVSTQIAGEALGTAGSLSLTAPLIQIQDNAYLSTRTLGGSSDRPGSGSAGDIILTADQVLVTGQSQLTSAVERPTAYGQGGDITIEAALLTLDQESTLNAFTNGFGAAGQITIRHNDRLSLDQGSQISTAVESEGQASGGNITIDSVAVTLRNQSSLTSSTKGRGSAGSIQVTGGRAIVVDNSQISTAIESTGVANPALPPSRITLTGGSVTLQNGATLTSETKGGKDPLAQGGTGDAGTIAITAQEDITLTGASSVLSAVGVNASGNAGGIQLVAQGNISLLEGSLLTASTSGKGDSGAIEITAQDFLAQGEDPFGFGSAIFSTVGRSAEGDSGGIKMTLTGTVSLLNGALLDATTYGKGDSGAIEITAQDVYLQGEDSAGFLSGILSAVEATGVGDSGGVRLTVGNNVLISNGARLDVSTSGQGNSGAIEVTAQQVSIQGNNSSGEFNSNVLSKVESTGVGNSGGVNIRARESLSLLEGGVVSTTTFGQGNSGAIDITTPSLLIQGAVPSEINTNLNNVQGAGISNIQSAVADTGRGNSGTLTVNASTITLLDGGQLNANTFGQGNSGLIDITTQDFLAQGKSPSGLYPSGVQSGVGETGIGNSQGINLSATGTVTLLDGALISASTLGTASDRSNITLTTPILTLESGSSLTASTAGFRDPGFNNAGTIELTTATTTLTGGSTITTNTAGSGAGGEIILTASQGLWIRDDGSGIFSNTEANSTGNAGSIFIDPPIVDIRDGAGISVNSLGAGTGGNITLFAGDLTLDKTAFISASTVNSNGGQIFLTIAGDLRLLNNSSLAAAAGLGQAAGGDGGSITIDAASILGFNNADISANAGLGRGGNITLNSPILLGFLVENVPDTSSDPRSNISASGQASAGTITINNSIDPSKGLDPLTVNLADLTSQVRRACDISSAQTLNQFRIAGRGGLPSTPQDPLQSQATLADLRLLDDWLSETPFSGKPIVSTPSLEPTLVPTLAGTAHWQWTAPLQVRLANSPCS